MANLHWYIRANLKPYHLQLLVALDELRSVSRVAGYLNVTQPAISKTLATIEGNLACTLFKRTMLGMEPTEHGKCLIRHARTILAQLTRLGDEMRDITQGLVSRISIGVLPAAATVFIPNFVARLESESVTTNLTIREGTMMDSLLPQLRAGDIDMIVGNLPRHSPGIEFETEMLYEDPIVMVVQRGHPLVSVPELNWDLIAKYPMVLPPEGTFTRTPINGLMARYRVPMPARVIESTSTLTNVGVLQATHSIGFLSRDVARHFAGRGELVELPFDLPDVTIRVGLVWRTDRLPTAAHQLARRIFHETRDAMMATAS